MKICYAFGGGDPAGVCDSFVIGSEFSAEWKFALFCGVVKIDFFWDVRPCWLENSRLYSGGVSGSVSRVWHY